MLDSYVEVEVSLVLTFKMEGLGAKHVFLIFIFIRTNFFYTDLIDLLISQQTVKVL